MRRRFLPLWFLLACLLSGCRSPIPDCDPTQVHLIYLEPLGATPTLPETWLARRCAGVLTVSDADAFEGNAEAYPLATLLLHRESSSVLEAEWVALEYEAGRPIVALDMNMSEFDSAAPFMRTAVLDPIRQPNQPLWSGACQVEAHTRATVAPLTSVTSLLAWSQGCLAIAEGD